MRKSAVHHVMAELDPAATASVGRHRVQTVRTGAEYRRALRDGRKIWVVGEGLIDDVTTHPATRAMVGEYVAWYDRHLDPAWQDVVLTPPDATGNRGPW